ncbi:putative uncharacterized protein DDB_G0282129 [Leptopilina boulardi]|uniref:putative uncharacterized protein DDB_G0282129 n=1 Tax=Leptopilina boulardi TaxID=63433 RepID=UPI0021F64CE3|nr:putative uncharacterized protein DDB_G0282129 [Leptopilina boulardi]
MQPSYNRSSPSCLQTRTTSSSTLLHHHHQPQSFYGPVTLQPFTAVLHPTCIYSTQRNTGPSAAHMTPQGSQLCEWQTKNKTQAVNLRNQRKIFYSTKPFDQQQINPQLPTVQSPYLLSASNFCHGPYSTDQNNSGLTVLSQPYFKPPDVQALCLVQDRQFITQQQTHQYNPYYNLSSTLQTVTANTNLQLPTQITSYPQFTNNLSLHTNQLFPNPNIFNPLKENSQSSAMEISLKYPKTKSNPFITQRNDYEKNENPSSDYRQFCAEVQNKANSSTKTQDLSDDSSTSFDFTIEAEKMVSALCNTSSNDLDKNTKTKTHNGAGDVAFNKNLTNTQIVQSESSVALKSHNDDNNKKYPELIRKTTIWGCNQAENILNSAKYHRTTKLEWLMNLSIATRTAITKSSTCFSIFAGDRILIQDLINSLLRISNGWLILDNYLNKQNSINNDKYDENLIKNFHLWESVTNELLQNIIKTFLQLEEKSEQQEIETSGTPGTFPGDVSIYTKCDLLEPPVKFNPAPGTAIISPIQNFQYQKKGTKPKSKWTITESHSKENLQQSKNKFDIKKETSLNDEFFNLKNKIYFQDSGNKSDVKNFEKKIFKLPNMTLLSQIEPNTTATKKEEMTANLSAWFASMRNDSNESEINFLETEINRDKIDLSRQFNHQLLSLQNMQSIQSAPWNAANLINNHYQQQTHDNDSSEDVRIYMKPGSYNVPKKRHQKRTQRKIDNSRHKSSKIETNFYRKINSFDETNNSQDITWKAACASAEVLLGALNINSQQEKNFDIPLIKEQISDNRDEFNNKDHIFRNKKIFNENDKKKNEIQKIKDKFSIKTARNNESMINDNLIQYQNEISQIIIKQNSIIRNQEQIKKQDLYRNQEQNNQRINKNYIISEQDQMMNIQFIEHDSQITRNHNNNNNLIENQNISKNREQFNYQNHRRMRNQEQINNDDRIEKKCNELLRERDQQIIRNQNRRTKSKKDASSYEASEDDSEPSPKTSSRSLKRLNEMKIGKTNVKTDSWLIRTLNNISKENNLASSDSLNSSIHENDQITKSSKVIFPNFSKIHQLPINEHNHGKATYSETVRRSNQNKNEMTKLTDDIYIPFCKEKINKKDQQRFCKISGKRYFNDTIDSEIQIDDKIKGKYLRDETKIISGKSTLGRGRRKDNNNLIIDGKYKSDRGWSVWYSSKKKQILNPLSVKKLETIHQTLWKMDETCLFKYPSSTGIGESQHKMIDNYCKIVKTPMFLETIGQKLKNRVYLKVEHAVRDFRKIVSNSKIYHKNNGEYLSKIDSLSKKMEQLFEEHFSNLDFENVSSNGDTSPVCQRFKLQSQRNRCNSSKKSFTSSDKINIVNEHNLN